MLKAEEGWVQEFLSFLVYLLFCNHENVLVCMVLQCWEYIIKTLTIQFKMLNFIQYDKWIITVNINIWEIWVKQTQESLYIFFNFSVSWRLFKNENLGASFGVQWVKQSRAMLNISHWSAGFSPSYSAANTTLCYSTWEEGEGAQVAGSLPPTWGCGCSSRLPA